MNGSSPPPASSGKSKKFMFDTHDFNDDVEEEIEEEVEPPPPTFSEEELEKAKQKSFDDGYRQAKQEAENSRERQITEYSGIITQHLTDLFSQEEQRIKLYEAESISLAHAIFEQLFPTYSKKHGLDEVKQTIESVLERHYENPSITISVPADYVEDIKTMVTERLDQTIAERITVTADKKLGAGDCHISWNNGGARRSATLIAENISTHLQQTLEEQPDMDHNNKDSLDDPSLDESIDQAPSDDENTDRQQQPTDTNAPDTAQSATQTGTNESKDTD